MDFDRVYDPDTKCTYRFVERLQDDERTRAESIVRRQVASEREAMGLPPVGRENPEKLWCGHPREALVETPEGWACGRCA